MSAVSRDRLVTHLVEEYGLDPSLTLQPIHSGRAMNFQAASRGGRWLFKVFQPGYTRERVEAAARFVAFLAARGYPVRPYVLTRSGDTVSALGGRATVLIPYVDGTIAPLNGIVEPVRLREVGRLCGMLHCLADDFDGKDALGLTNPAGAVDLRAALAKLEHIAERAGASGDGAVVDQVGVRRDILSGLGPTLRLTSSACVPGMIAGDFHGEHLVWSDSATVAAVIDVVGEVYYPAWEMMRTFFMSAPPLDAMSDLQLNETWQAFAGGYLGEWPVLADQLAAGYDLYLLELVKSPYGLVPEPDFAADPTREAALRRFGAWRTRMVEALARRRDTFHRLVQ